MQFIFDKIRLFFAKIINSKIVYNRLDFDYIQQKLESNQIKKCLDQVTMENDAKFYKGAQVHNLQFNKNKINIGQNSHIQGELLIFSNGGEIIIGSNVYIGEGSRIRSAENIIIGNNVLISHNCNIIDTDSHEINYLERAEGFKKLIKNGHSKEKGNINTKAIHIEDYVWISYNVSILKGIKIGKGSIVAAGSVVTKNVPPFTLVAGNPAKIIKQL